MDKSINRLFVQIPNWRSWKMAMFSNVESQRWFVQTIFKGKFPMKTSPFYRWDQINESKNSPYFTIFYPTVNQDHQVEHPLFLDHFPRETMGFHSLSPGFLSSHGWSPPLSPLALNPLHPPEVAFHFVEFEWDLWYLISILLLSILYHLQIFTYSIVDGPAKSESPLENGGKHPIIGFQWVSTILLVVQDFATTHRILMV